MRAWAANPASITETMGRVKSITACASAINGSGSAVSLIPLAASPANWPASRPRSGWPSASSAPDRTSPGAWAISRTSARPMRPDAPATTMLRSAIGLDLGVDRRRVAARHRHHGGTQQAVTDHVARLHHIDDGTGRLAVARHFGDRLMQIGIEFPAFGGDGLHAIALQGRHQLP